MKYIRAQYLDSRSYIRIVMLADAAAFYVTPVDVLLLVADFIIVVNSGVMNSSLLYITICVTGNLRSSLKFFGTTSSFMTHVYDYIKVFTLYSNSSS